MVAALEHTIGALEVVTDCRSVWDGFHGGKKNGNHDLWKRLEQARSDRNIQCKWMRAHCTWEEARITGVEHDDWAGNDAADKIAKAGASRHGANENGQIS